MELREVADRRIRAHWREHMVTATSHMTRSGSVIIRKRFYDITNVGDIHWLGPAQVPCVLERKVSRV